MFVHKLQILFLTQINSQSISHSVIIIIIIIKQTIESTDCKKFARSLRQIIVCFLASLKDERTCVCVCKFGPAEQDL